MKEQVGSLFRIVKERDAKNGIPVDPSNENHTMVICRFYLKQFSHHQCCGTGSVRIRPFLCHPNPYTNTLTVNLLWLYIILSKIQFRQKKIVLI